VQFVGHPGHGPEADAERVRGRDSVPDRVDHIHHARPTVGRDDLESEPIAATTHSHHDRAPVGVPGQVRG
jgi:hypothetical protein